MHQKLQPILKQEWPIILGYLPVGLACGLLLTNAGLQWWQIGLMSAFVYGGSAQFMAASLMVNGAGMLEVLVIIILLNSRHILLTSSLAPYLQKEPGWKAALLGMFTSDENYALNIVRFRQDEAGESRWSVAEATTLAAMTYLSWFTFTILGSFIGQWVALPEVITNFLLVSLFIALLIPELRNIKSIRVSLLTMAIAIVLMILFNHSLVIIVSTLIALLVVAWLDNKETKSKRW